MSLVRQFVHHPRPLLLRRMLFQVHLWVGLLLSAYLVVIALSGAVLVWEDELTAANLPAGLSQYQPGHEADADLVLGSFQRVYPGARLSQLIWPNAVVPAFRMHGSSQGGAAILAVADPATGQVQAQPRSWMLWVHDLHVYLLLGTAHGEQVNGVGAAGLLLLAATGLVLWWPGVRLWTRGLRVHWRASWRRINFDLHHAIGIWTLLIVSWWAVSGIYFAWYKPVTAAVAAVSPLHGMQSPGLPAGLPPVAAGTPSLGLSAVLRAARAASPRGHLYSASDPLGMDRESYVLLDLQRPGDFSHRDIVRVREADARVLTVWHYGQRKSLGDWVLWSMHPLHFGTVWGWPGKIIWSGLGLSLAILTVTGLLMYWNRYLRQRWHALNTV